MCQLITSAISNHKKNSYVIERRKIVKIAMIHFAPTENVGMLLIIYPVLCCSGWMNCSDYSKST